MRNSQGGVAPYRILLAIPCYNEEGAIGPLLREIRSLHADYDMIVVDDGSRDNTYGVASAMAPCLRLIANLGIGGGVQTSIKYAFERGYDLCVQVDGDGQHPASEICVLVDSYRASPANLIIGSRFLADGEFRSTFARRVGIQAISAAIRWFFGCRVTDPTSGFRIMDREAIRIFSAEYPHDFPESISVAVALEHGLSIREVPVRMRAREHGDSSIQGLKRMAYMLRVIGYLALIRLKRIF